MGTLVAEADRIPLSNLTKGRTVETLRVTIPVGVVLNLGEAATITTPATTGVIAEVGEATDVNASGIMNGYYDATDAACEADMITIAPNGLEKAYITVATGAVEDIVLPYIPFTDTTNVQGELDG